MQLSTIVKLIRLRFKLRKTEIDKVLRKDSIEWRP